MADFKEFIEVIVDIPVASFPPSAEDCTMNDFPLEVIIEEFMDVVEMVGVPELENLIRSGSRGGGLDEGGFFGSTGVG